MTNQIAQTNERSVTFEANGEQVTLSPSTVKRFLVNGNDNISTQETVMFINLCKYQHLNPFLNEAYIIKYGNKPAQLITSKEAFMKRAESNPQYNGFKAGCIVLRNDEVVYTNGAFILDTDKLLGGWAEVSRKDRNIPVRVELSMKEFSKNQSTWKSMPATMIRKTAIVNALRETFPDTLGGMYTEDDNLKADNHTTAERHDVTPQEEQAQALVDQALKPDDEVKEKAEEKEVTEFVEVDGEGEPNNEQSELFNHWGEPNNTNAE